MTVTAVSDIQSPAAAGAEVARSLAELRDLLATAKGQRGKDWQETVARHVALLFADYVGQSDERVALCEISVISLAAQKGSTGAKKLNLRPVRWISSAPPELSECVNGPDEAKAAIRVLRPIKAAWTVGYIQRELTKNKWPEITGELIAWQLRSSPTVEAFLHAISSTDVPSGISAAAWIGNVLQAALKILARAHVSSGPGFMAAVEQVAARARLPSDLGAERQRAQRAIVALVSQRSSVDPAVLLQGGAVGAVRAMAALSSPPDVASIVEFEAMTRRMVAVTSMLVPLADRAMLSHLRNVWAAYRDYATRVEQVLKTAVTEHPALGVMEMAEDDLTDGEPRVTEGLEGVLTELIANWESYSAQHHGDPAVRQLSLRIDGLIEYLGVGRFGAEGEIVPFDPLRHHVPEATATPPARVRVSRAGIAMLRPDGTSRVLLKAIVSPA